MSKPRPWPIPDGIICGITGASGAGKTTLLSTLCKQHKLMVLDADGHARARLRQQVAAGRCVVRRVNTYNDGVQAVTDLREGLPDIECVALDSLPLYNERLVREAVVDRMLRGQQPQEEGKRKRSVTETPGMEERVLASDRLRSVFLWLAELADPDQYEHPRHVFFTCLEGRWKESDLAVGKEGFVQKRATQLGEGNIGAMRYGPLLPGKFADDFGAWMTEHFHLVVRDGRKRTLVTDFDGQFQAKDASGVLDFEEPPDLVHVLKKIYGR